MKLTTGVDFLCQQASSCLDKGKAELCPLTDLMFKKKFYRVCHKFKLTKRVAYFWVDFEHF